MSPRLRRILIPLAVMAIATGVIWSMVLGGRRGSPTPPPTPPATATVEPTGGEPDAPDEQAEVTAPVKVADQPESEPAPPAEPDPAQESDPQQAPATRTLRAMAPPGGLSGPDEPLQELGSLDPRQNRLHLVFSRIGAGLKQVTLADQWLTAESDLQAAAHDQAVAEGRPNVPPLPEERLRYVLAAEQDLKPQVRLPALAAHSLLVDGTMVFLLYDVDELTGQRRSVWTETAPGSFQSLVVDEDDRPVLRVRRTYELATDGRLTLRQRVANLTDEPLRIKWIQYGPADLVPDRSRYIDRRRFRFGHLLSPVTDPSRRIVMADKALLNERRDIIKNPEELLWPNKDSDGKGYELSWFGATNRYFALTIHPPMDDLASGSRSIEHVVGQIGHEAGGDDRGPLDERVIFSELFSPEYTLAGGQELVLDLGVYAGPLDADLLDQREPYATLNMRELVLYQMSACCTICTFQWLAKGLLAFLSVVHTVLGDWGIAIILLVCLVRALLHPLTKRGQISMQRFSRQMAKMKPEIDRLQAKYRDEPKRMQGEQMRLMREHGVNPIQFLGCLPMFLQMPIWIALYAMLYFAFPIRHEPAFYGVFQMISGGAWPFLSDLSAADRFIPLFSGPRIFRLAGFIFDYSAINILPLSMGILFYLQQKYMTPPPGPGMSKEQAQQQKIMKVLMVVMMPVLLYSAPSGLTLYIFTSSCIGILEGRYIRSHLKDMDLETPTKKKSKKTKPRDRLGRAYADAMQRAQAARREKTRGPAKTFKKKKR